MDSSPSSPPVTAQPNTALGISLKIVSVVFFVGMQTCIKAAGPEVPPGEIVFFRSFFALVPVAAYLGWLGILKTAFVTNDLLGHVWRGIVGVTSMGLGFFALTRLPYPEFVAISYASALLTVVFAAIFLREVVRSYRWTAVIVGLAGVFVVSAPKLTILGSGFGNAETSGVVIALAAAAVGAVAAIQVRRLVRTERTATIVLYFSIMCSAIALLSIFFGWKVPTRMEATYLVAAGLCGGMGQLLLTGCYRYADASTIAPFEYSSLILAIGVGVFLFDETISLTTIIGSLIVIGAGVFIIYREHQLGIERNKARRVTTPNG
ncbi:DMT family transporter [Consotaella salsifontis]|uniref:Permease of the drug/metabolite transporter (DMT) superfamily n=1 Tax=Consotaella salsifontis TaxID=1365950 RepID=A0A1T4SWF8_9HYPH|nr:DMT family transporter [Consotaella salsifontis]SKA32502.1 Permease of the drug/metabolite transporter (DMT) superfamily [Consotaella salsifontis]